MMYQGSSSDTQLDSTMLLCRYLIHPDLEVAMETALQPTGRFLAARLQTGGSCLACCQITRCWRVLACLRLCCSGSLVRHAGTCLARCMHCHGCCIPGTQWRGVPGVWHHL